MMTTLRTSRILVAVCALFAASMAPAQDDAGEAADERESVEPAVSGPALDDAGAAGVGNTNDRPAMDTLDLGRTEITGNQELPKVLYIVPWQKSDPGNLLGRPVNTLLDEVLAPLDREEFIRQVDYYSDLGGPQDE